jgi:hypothetical protein
MVLKASMMLSFLGLGRAVAVDFTVAMEPEVREDTIRAPSLEEEAGSEEVAEIERDIADATMESTTEGVSTAAW